MAIHRILFILCCLFLYGCGAYQVEEDIPQEKKNGKETETKKYKVKLTVTGKGNAPLDYPLSFFVFNQEQQCILQEEIEEEDLPFSVSLPQGKYRLSLFSGLQKNQCTIPDNPTDESRIRLPEKNSCKEAVLFGKTYIDVVRSTTAKITLDYAVTAISVSLTGIPADAQAVAVQFAPVSSGIDFKGNPADDRQHCTLHCYKYEKRWVCNPTYIIPHSQGETSVSIRVTLPQEEEIHEYTYKAALKPGYPYRFNGDLETNLALEGDFHIEGWQPEIDVELGADKNPSGEETQTGTSGETHDKDSEKKDPEQKDIDTFIASELPPEDVIWGYFYIWKLQRISEHEALATLIAPNQAFAFAGDAIKWLQNYRIDGISGWRVFTTEEAQAFRNQFGNRMGDLNNYLYENGMARFYYSKEARYLCNQGQSTFSFTSTRITNAGKTVKYYLRPVKNVKIKTQ